MDGLWKNLKIPFQLVAFHPKLVLLVSFQLLLRLASSSDQLLTTLCCKIENLFHWHFSYLSKLMCALRKIIVKIPA